MKTNIVDKFSQVTILGIVMFAASVFAADKLVYVGKCREFADATQKQMQAQVLQMAMSGESGNVYDLMYPALVACLFNDGGPEQQFSEIKETMKPTKKGFALWDKIAVANYEMAVDYAESGSTKNPKYIPCLINDDMLEAMNHRLWNTVIKQFQQSGVSRDVSKFVFLDKKTCADWGSRKAQKDDFR